MGEEHLTSRRPGVGPTGFLRLPPPPKGFVWLGVGRVVARDRPEGAVLVPAHPTGTVAMVTAAFLLASSAAAVLFGWNWTDLDRDERKLLVLFTLMALAIGMSFAAAIPFLLKLNREAKPLLVEHARQSVVELPRRGVRIPSKSIVRVQSVSGYVAHPPENADKENPGWFYHAQLFLIEALEKGEEGRRLIGCAPHEIPTGIRRAAAELARLLGVPHEHIEVRVRDGVRWADLYECADVHSADGAQSVS